MEYELYDSKGRLVQIIVTPEGTEAECEEYAEQYGRNKMADQFGSVELIEE